MLTKETYVKYHNTDDYLLRTLDKNSSLYEYLKRQKKEKEAEKFRNRFSKFKIKEKAPPVNKFTEEYIYGVLEECRNRPSEENRKRYGHNTVTYDDVYQDILYNKKELDWDVYYRKTSKSYNFHVNAQRLLWMTSSIWLPALIGTLYNGIEIPPRADGLTVLIAILCPGFLGVLAAHLFTLGLITPVSLFLGAVVAPKAVKFLYDPRVVDDESDTLTTAAIATGYMLGKRKRR